MILDETEHSLLGSEESNHLIVALNVHNRDDSRVEIKWANRKPSVHAQFVSRFHGLLNLLRKETGRFIGIDLREYEPGRAKEFDSNRSHKQQKQH